MRKVIVYLLTIIILGVSFMGCSSRDPNEELLRRPIEEIREYLLELTPVGSSMNYVAAVIEGNEAWTLWSVNNRNGFAMHNGWPTEPEPNDIAAGNVIGTQRIRAEFGNYRRNILSLYVTHVTVFWGFDENSQLIDIQVRK